MPLWCVLYWLLSQSRAISALHMRTEMCMRLDEEADL